MAICRTEAELHSIAGMGTVPQKQKIVLLGTARLSIGTGYSQECHIRSPLFQPNDFQQNDHSMVAILPLLHSNYHF
jgi:hypothetical protein